VHQLVEEFLENCSVGKRHLEVDFCGATAGCVVKRVRGAVRWEIMVAAAGARVGSQQTSW
jgi:hypothetical protein